MDVFFSKHNSLLPKILIVVIVFLAVLGISNLFEKEIKNLFYFLTQPLQKVVWRAGDSMSNFLSFFSNAQQLTQENQKLTAKNQELLSEIVSLQDVKAENQALNEAINNNPDKDLSLILTDVIGIDSYGDSILINKGKKDGILKDMAVINSERVLFGKVFEVYNSFSKVMLISNKDSVLDIKLQKDDTIFPPIYGVVKGKGNLSAYLDLVQLECEIKGDDILITSSLEGVFPKGLLVGQIIEACKDDLKPFQSAEIKLFLDLKKTDKLFIVSDYKKEK